MNKKIIKKSKILVGLLLASTVSLHAVSFGSAANEKDKTININGEEFNYVIGTASKTGKYFGAGTKLCVGIKDCVAADTDGSKQNMELLAQGYINGALVQADAFNTYLEANPQYKDVLLAADLGAEEQVQIVMKKGANEDELQSSKATIYIGPLKSGGAASWTAMTKLEPGYAKAAVISDTYDATSAIALNKLESGEYTAIIRTSMANADDKFVKAVQTNPNLQFVNVDDKDLNDTIKVNGKDEPLYKFVPMQTANGFFGGKSIETISTKVLFVFNKDMYSTRQLNEMLDNINTKKSGLFK